MKWLACFGAAAAMAWAQSGGALLSNPEALKLEQRAVQLMESTGLAVPGLARAGAPALEDARQALANLQTAPQNAGQHIHVSEHRARAIWPSPTRCPSPIPFPRKGGGNSANCATTWIAWTRISARCWISKETQLHNPDPRQSEALRGRQSRSWARRRHRSRAWCFWAIRLPMAGGSTNIMAATATS